MADTIRVGVLGPGAIVRRVMKDFQTARGVCLTAVASRSMERAQAAAAEYGAKYAFSSYEELAQCDEVDLVYVATPHPFHCEQAIMMMNHGKHVLCEKPMTTTAADARRMAECARKNGVLLMEAMWTRCFPATKKLVELVQAGEIGKVRHIYGVFCFAVDRPDPAGRLFSPELAGGALLDIGVYPLMAITRLMGWKPEKMQLLSTLTETGVDGRMAVQMQYANGVTAQLMTALDAMDPADLTIYGDRGYIRMDDFWHPTSFTVYHADGGRVDYTFRAENEGFRHEFEEAAACIREGRIESAYVTNEESIAICDITEKLRHEAGVFYPWEK